jgi:hypothetical protein
VADLKIGHYTTGWPKWVKLPLPDGKEENIQLISQPIYFAATETESAALSFCRDAVYGALATPRSVKIAAM